MSPVQYRGTDAAGRPVPKNPANRTPPEIVEKVLHLRRTYHLGPIRIVWYLARYHDIKISDAGVYRISDDLAVVLTTDFFTPIVDDPYWFGAIAAANSLSDVWAMGAKPLVALNIAMFPNQQEFFPYLKKIMQGGIDKMAEAGVSIIGGHTIRDKEPKFGFAVMGTIHPETILDNSKARPGDSLILTKKIGTGIISTGVKAGKGFYAWTPEKAQQIIRKYSDHIALPILIRFSDILRARVEALNEAFHKAIAEYGYKGRYLGVYPIKVNQQRHVVEELMQYGRPFNLGIEAGSKPELLVALAQLSLLGQHQPQLALAGDERDMAHANLSHVRDGVPRSGLERAEVEEVLGTDLGVDLLEPEHQRGVLAEPRGEDRLVLPLQVVEGDPGVQRAGDDAEARHDRQHPGECRPYRVRRDAGSLLGPGGAALRQRHGNIHRDGRFTDAALARSHHDDLSQYRLPNLPARSRLRRLEPPALRLDATPPAQGGLGRHHLVVDGGIHPGLHEPEFA